LRKLFRSQQTILFLSMKLNRYFCLMLVSTSMLSVPTMAAEKGNDTTPQQVFDGMRRSFQTQKAKGVHARYQWDLSGPTGGQWWIDVEDGKFNMGRGKIDNPSVTFVASDKTWVALSNGTLGGKWAFFTGRLKIRGSQALARKLDEIFP
jgi:putative sterol carrier protein